MTNKANNFLVIDSHIYNSEPSVIEAIRTAINSEKIVILKNFVSALDVLSLRNEVYSWGGTVPLEPPQSFHDKSNYTSIEKGVSPSQKTLHYYQAYNLHDSSNTPFTNNFNNVFKPMVKLFNRYRETDVEIIDDNHGFSLRPQLLHFFKGGGFLSSHYHKKDPQEIGLILMASKRYSDFEDCTVAFVKDDQIIDPIELLELGDLLLFNYGQQHWVTSCDIEDKMRFDNSGFWIFTLPYY